MHSDSEFGRPTSGDVQTRPLKRHIRRRGLALGAGAVLALIGTVLGVTIAGMPSGRGAVTAVASGAGARHRHHADPASRNAPGRHAPGQSGPGQAAASGQSARKVAASGKNTSKSAHESSRASGRALRTSCHQVAHIGDSTSVDLISSAFLPDASQRLGARYHDVGVRHVRIDASGGRSIVEEMPGQLNGDIVASGWRAHGYHGCWVFALGTNDAANVAVGSTVGYTARIDRMMADAHGQPVMWVNTKTELSTGPWAESNERAWDAALTKALARYPNLRIFNWSAVAKPAWFLSDGIHYNTTGCAARAKAIADALARAFPLHGHSEGRVVR